MIIEVRVKPRSSKEEIEKLDRNSYKVYMRQPAESGKANKKLVEMLAEYFNIAKSKVKIIKGLRSRNKILDISL